MADNNHSCVTGIVSAFFSGALVGAGLALILAPVSGKEARQHISHQYNELKDKIKELEKKVHKSREEDVPEKKAEEKKSAKK